MNNYIRQQYLDAIGIQSWQLKSAVDNDILDSLDDDVLEIIEESQPVVEQKPQQLAPEPQQIIQEPLSVVEQEPQPRIIDPEQFAPEPQPSKPEPSISEPASNPVSNLIIKEQEQEQVEAKATTVERVEIVDIVESDLELDQTIKNCKQCPGRQTRLNALAGQGNSNASVFVISDAPNAEEDRAGHYLTEQSLSLFQSMLHSINSHDDYFFTGIIKCHSLSDFLVSEDEINHCASFLHTQIEQTKPSVLLVLGAAQAQTMLQSKQTFNELRGKVYHIKINDQEYPLVVSYHPAYLLRNPIYKREALKDLIMIKNLIK